MTTYYVRRDSPQRRERDRHTFIWHLDLGGTGVRSVCGHTLLPDDSHREDIVDLSPDQVVCGGCDRTYPTFRGKRDGHRLAF